MAFSLGDGAQRARACLRNSHAIRATVKKQPLGEIQSAAAVACQRQGR